MSGKISTLPIWKKGASAEERFQELVMMAREHPERFKRMCVIWVEEDSAIRTRYHFEGCTTLEGIGLLNLVSQKLYNDTHRS